MVAVCTEVFTYLLAIYGAFALISSITYSIRLRTTNSNTDVKLVLMVRNQENTIEGAVRDIFSKHIVEDITPGEKLAIIDMGSTDQTPDMLEKLEDDYCIQVYKEREKDRIFETFRQTGEG
ncbi:MAG TPA: hypothetical protein VHT34_01225 [Clostridia bacterium]|nr:hypothetical protein [Clostridia bacterium]